MSVFDLAVVGPGAESQAAVAALSLTSGWRQAAVVVSDGGATAQLGIFAMPAARDLAALAGAQGTTTCARGRLAFVRPRREELVSVARRIVARSAAPVVIALTEPRDDVADVLLAESIRVVVLTEPEGPVARLALEQLVEIGVVAEARLAVAGPSLHLGRLGWPAPRSAPSLAAAQPC